MISNLKVNNLFTLFLISSLSLNHKSVNILATFPKKKKKLNDTEIIDTYSPTLMLIQEFHLNFFVRL